MVHDCLCGDGTSRLAAVVAAAAVIVTAAIVIPLSLGGAGPLLPKPQP